MAINHVLRFATGPESVCPSGSIAGVGFRQQPGAAAEGAPSMSLTLCPQQVDEAFGITGPGQHDEPVIQREAVG